MDEPRLIRLDAQPALVIEAEAAADKICEKAAELWPLLEDYARIFGALAAGAPFVRYLGCGVEGRLRFEAGIPTLVPLPDGDEIRTVTLAGGTAVTCTHEGPHSGVAAVHAELDQWMETSGRRPAAPRVESYLTGGAGHARTLISQVIEE